MVAIDDLLKGNAAREWNTLKQTSISADLRELDLSDRDLSGYDFSSLDLSRCNFAGSKLSSADFTDSILIDACFSNCDLFDLDQKDTHKAHTTFHRANLTSAKFDKCVGENVDFSDSKITEADFSSCKLETSNFEVNDGCRSNFEDAILDGSSLTGPFVESNFSNGRLVDCNIVGADLRLCDLSKTLLYGVVYKPNISCRGIQCDSVIGNALLKRDLQDQDWIETFREQSRLHYLLYWVWLISCNCGRSLTLILAWCIVLAGGFGYLYSDEFPGGFKIDDGFEKTGFTPYYYSLVIMTTLGLGDLQPLTLHCQILTVVQVVISYGLLGLIVSILASKVARRS